MENKLKVRSLVEEDYDIICQWWKQWKWPVLPRTALPNNATGGFIVEKNNIPIVSGFLYLSNSQMAALEWVVSNPEYREKDRKQAIELLINTVEKACVNMDFKHLITLGRNKHLIQTHKKLGWHVDKTPSYEIIKNL